MRRAVILPEYRDSPAACCTLLLHTLENGSHKSEVRTSVCEDRENLKALMLRFDGAPGA